MQNIKVTRYADNHSWQGHIGPADESWSLYIHADGRPIFFVKDPITGFEVPYEVMMLGEPSTTEIIEPTASRPQVSPM